MTPLDAAQGLSIIYGAALSTLVAYRLAANYVRRMVDR